MTVGRRLTLLVCAGLGLGPASTPAATTAAELVATCRAALDAGYRGPQAAMCDWFIDPCEICDVAPVAPRWCPPPELAGAPRARFMVKAIAERAGAGRLPAREVVAGILAGHFPCTARIGAEDG